MMEGMMELTWSQKQVLASMMRNPDHMWSPRSLCAKPKTLKALEAGGYVVLFFRSPLIDSEMDGVYWKITEKGKQQVQP
jgi:hypothetical protein